jgi:hypothetical protein
MPQSRHCGSSMSHRSSWLADSGQATPGTGSDTACAACSACRTCLPHALPNAAAAMSCLRPVHSKLLHSIAATQPIAVPDPPCSPSHPHHAPTRHSDPPPSTPPPSPCPTRTQAAAAAAAAAAGGLPPAVPAPPLSVQGVCRAPCRVTTWVTPTAMQVSGAQGAASTMLQHTSSSSSMCKPCFGCPTTSWMQDTQPLPPCWSCLDCPTPPHPTPTLPPSLLPPPLHAHPPQRCPPRAVAARRSGAAPCTTPPAAPTTGAWRRCPRRDSWWPCWTNGWWGSQQPRR